MNDNTNACLNYLYNYLNNDQSYLIYNYNMSQQSSYTSPPINQTIYDKLLHDFQNYSS